MFGKKKQNRRDELHIFHTLMDIQARIGELERMCRPDDKTSKMGEVGINISLGRKINSIGEIPLHVRIHELEKQMESLKGNAEV